MDEEKIKVKTTFKEWLGVTTILLVWACSVMMIYTLKDFGSTIIWVLLTIPGLYCWTVSVTELQKY